MKIKQSTQFAPIACILVASSFYFYNNRKIKASSIDYIRKNEQVAEVGF